MSVKFVFPTTLSRATEGAATLLVMAQHALFEGRPMGKLVGPDIHKWLVELARDVRPGDCLLYTSDAADE